MLVAGIGNIFLSDDGFGPEVARRLAATDLPDDVRVIDYGIRGMHLAYDLLDGYDGLIIVDAVPAAGSDALGPGQIRTFEVSREDLVSQASGPSQLDAHSMDPLSVLRSLDALGGQLPPTVVVGCVPVDLDERIGLSDPVAAAVPEAMSLVLTLLTAGADTRNRNTVATNVMAAGQMATKRGN